MSLLGDQSAAEGPLAEVKEQSGRRIEEARKREGITQRQLAKDLGMGVRWLREIESGNPKARLDDHLRCAYQLGMSTGHILIPLLFAGQKMTFPRQLAYGDLRELERLCVETIAQRNLEQLTQALTPNWRRLAAGGM
ncbi:helix-turn-helix domain-containing protein [Sphingomonas sp. OTU376]|uniref:helix-turn-helix domain-containing protein n=1 Tax=Sphingomonas sp. OTU376 TaxID=3043863 RepID=UPI00313D2F07